VIDGFMESLERSRCLSTPSYPLEKTIDEMSKDVIGLG